MIEEKQLTEEQKIEREQNKWGLEAIADMLYCVKISLYSLEVVTKQLKPSILKDVCYDFRNKQETQLNRLMRAANDYGRKNDFKIKEAFEKDLDSDELITYYAILTELKQASEMECLAEIISHANKLGDKLPTIAPKLILWLKNEIELNK